MKRSDRTLRGTGASRGGASIEYLGVVVVVTLVVGALLATTVWDDIAVTARREVCRVMNEGDDSGCPDNVVGAAGDGDGQSGSGGGATGGSGDQQAGDSDGGQSGKSDGKHDGTDGNALPNVCFEPRERASHSNVSVPGNGPVSTAAAWGYSMLVNYVIDKVNNEQHKEERVQKALADLAYCLPDYNIVIAQPHEGNLQEMDGAAMIATADISGSTYRIYAFKTGKFVWADDADLGWKNRAFRGWYDVSDDRRTVTFDEPPHPKRKKDWKPGDEGCEIEGQQPPDRDRYYNTYSPLDDEGSTAAVRMLVNDLRRCYPDYNVVAMHSEQSSHWVDDPDTMVYHGRYRLNSNEFTEDEKGNDIASGRAVFDVYVFDNGTFSNDGDGGYTNWAYYGDFTRDGSEVTFQQPEPADLDADPTPTGGAPVNFDDGKPKYTDGGPYPGTDYSGDVPKDKGELTQSLIEEYGRSFPDKNIIAVKSLNDMTFSGVSGLEHLATVNGVDVYSIDQGTVTNKGDGGWQNWGFTGNFERSGDDGKEVTFSSR